MSGAVWEKAELDKLRLAYKNKPEWITDMELAKLLSPQMNRSVESIRWQMRQWHVQPEQLNSVAPPKILLLDIETLPMEVLLFSPWNQNVHMEQIKKDWSVLCWSAKWLFDPKVMGQVVTPREAQAHDDSSVLLRLWELMNEANYIVTHNGDDFDIKKLNARFFVKGYPKPMYFQSIDTKKIANQNFGFTYAKLDWIAQIVGIGRKIETDFKWWKECEAGNEEYLKKMLKYNKQDVHLEEEVYLKLRPWMDKHPNLNLYANHIGDVCPTCGSTELNWKGQYATGVSLYKAFRCENCGAIGRSQLKKNKLSKSEVQN